MKQSYVAHGREFSLFRFNDKVAWYVHKGEQEIHEVFMIHRTEACDVIIGGKTVHFDAGISIPGDNAFGSWAWCSTVYKNAEKIFKERSNT